MKYSVKMTLNSGMTWLFLALLSCLVLVGCETKASPAVPDATTAINVELFKISYNCAACHQALFDSLGNDVSIHNEWQMSIMANAARDPYYLASVKMEMQNSPEYAEPIEEKCASCHAPMARFSNEAAGEQTILLGDQGVIDPDHPLFDLAVDGVSCSVCHQIPENMEGHFRNSGDLGIDLNLLADERFIYGALPISEQNLNIMKTASGYTAVQSEHVRESAVCASCHELYLNYIQADGTLSTEEDLFYEQTPYSEWLVSDYVGQLSCQNCHMPAAEGAAPISNITPQNLVDPFARHTFTGGNVFMLTLFNEFAEGLGIPEYASDFDEHTQRTEDYLQSETATLVVSALTQQDDNLSFNVGVDVLTGHKFPTSFPSRRTWLHITISDALGGVVFESGGYDGTGKIFGNENDENALGFEPHYDRISAPDQVQIYEPIMQDVYGEVTTIQMQAVGYLKDNRLLPRGFDKQNPPSVSGVIGNALQDETFIGGGDLLTYEIQTNGAQGPFTVQVELLYQSVGYRWAKNVLDSQSEEAQTFGQMLGQVGNIPVVVASETVTSQ